MRKNQTLLVAGILLLASTAVAQGQGVLEVTPFGATARARGAGEMTGSLLLARTVGDADAAVINVLYSAPLAAGHLAPTGGTSVMDGTLSPTNKQLVTYILDGNAALYVLPGVRVDLREVTGGKVTASVSSNTPNVFISGSYDVITQIIEPVAIDAGAKGTTVLTRGTPAGGEMKTIKIEEGFPGAFEDDTGLSLRISGLPNKAMLEISAVGSGTDNTAGIGGTVMLGDVLIVVESIAMTDVDDMMPESFSIPGTGKDIDVAIEFGDDDPDTVTAADPDNLKKETLTLRLVMKAAAGTTDLVFPLMGDVRVSVTMTPTTAGLPALGRAYFTENFVPDGGAIAFIIEPARCTLLYPYVTYNPPAMVDTGIAVTNPTGFGGDALSGPIKFSLYGNDSEPESYTTDAGTPGGMDSGLDENGNLAAGKTYSVLLSQLLLWARIEGTFEGHVYVETDFTRCSGLGLVWDNNGTFSQGYIPELIADEVTAGERGRTVTQ